MILDFILNLIYIFTVKMSDQLSGFLPNDEMKNVTTSFPFFVTEYVQLLTIMKFYLYFI